MQFNQVQANAVDDIGKHYRQPTDNELSALASLHRTAQTKKHLRLVLRLNGFSGANASVEALSQRIRDVNGQHRDRAQNRVLQRLSAIPDRSRVLQVACGSNRDPTPTPNVVARLDEVRRSAVVATAKSCLRYGAAGGSSFRVSLTGDPAAVGYEVVISSNRDTYRGRFKGWSATEDHHRICVPADWRLRVQRRGLATAGGMLTLDLQPLLGHGDIELFAAVWVGQGRGYGANVYRGVIARLGWEVYHAEDVQQAIRGITLKAKRAAEPARRPAGAYQISVDAFIMRYARYGAVDVSIDDARAIGACEYGIESWCHAVGIDVDEECVPISRILECFRIRPQYEVRRTVLYAIKNHRADAKAR